MGKFFDLFKKKNSNFIQNTEWVEVRVRKDLKFKGYRSKEKKRLKNLAGKIVFVTKVSEFFYLIKGGKIIIFFADFQKVSK